MATKPKKKLYDWGDKRGKVHTRAKKGERQVPKPKGGRDRPKGKGGGNFAEGLKRRTTESSRRRYIQKAAGRRTTLESRNAFLKKHKLRDPDLDDPNYFTRPQTLGQAQIEADRATNLRYGEQEQGLRNEQELIARQGRQIPAWFQQYQQNIAQAGAAQQAMAAPAIQQSQQVAAATSQPVLPPPTATGPTAPSASAAQNDQLAAASRGALANAFTQMMQSNQNANAQYFAGRQGVAGAAQIGLMGENNMRLRQNQQEATRLKGERGDYRATQLAGARDKERQYGLERSAFGLKVEEEKADQEQAKSKAASDRAKDRRDRRAERRKYRQDVREKGQARADKLRDQRIRNQQKDEDQELARRRLEQSGSGGKGGKPKYTPLQQREARSDLRKAIGLIRSKPGNVDWDTARKRLESKGNIDPLISRAAAEYARRGRVSDSTQRALQRDYGIRAPSRPRPTYNPGGSPRRGGSQFGRT